MIRSFRHACVCVGDVVVGTTSQWVTCPTITHQNQNSSKTLAERNAMNPRASPSKARPQHTALGSLSVNCQVGLGRNGTRELLTQLAYPPQRL